MSTTELGIAGKQNRTHGDTAKTRLEHLPDKDKSDVTHPVQQEPPKIRQDNTKLLQDISTAKKKNKKKHR